MALDPVRGHEADKVRPAVIVSNDGANRAAERRAHGVVTVVPLTSNTARILPFQSLLPAALTGLDLDSKAQSEQVRSVDSIRLVHRVGAVPPALMSEIDDDLRLHLAL